MKKPRERKTEREQELKRTRRGKGEEQESKKETQEGGERAEGHTSSQNEREEQGSKKETQEGGERAEGHTSSQNDNQGSDVVDGCEDTGRGGLFDGVRHFHSKFVVDGESTPQNEPDEEDDDAGG
jgi:hypothetical protein